MSNTGVVINPYSQTPVNETNVNVYPYVDKDNTQGWLFINVGDGKYKIVSTYNSLLVLTAQGSTNKANVDVRAYQEGNLYQLWTVEEYVQG